MMKMLDYDRFNCHNKITSKITIFLILLLLIFPNNSYSLKLQKISLSIPVENHLFLYSYSENTLTEISPLYFETKKLNSTIEMYNNDFFIIYSYAYGDIINTMPDNKTDGIKSISISLYILDNNGKKVDTILEEYMLPNPTCNIFKPNDLKKGYYQLSIHTETIADEYSDFFSYVKNEKKTTTYYFIVK